jgi:Putative Flp pilus-assembly TadE/G-like
MRAGRPRRGAEEGQILPALLSFALAVLAIGVLLFQVGRAADLRGRAQTATDAAAIAGAETVKRLYAEGIHQCNCPNQGMILDPPAAAAAAAYAARNGARMERFQRTGLVVRVTAGTFADLNDQDAAPLAGRASGHAGARARVFTDPALWPLAAAYTAAEQQIPVPVVLRFLHVRLIPDPED